MREGDEEGPQELVRILVVGKFYVEGFALHIAETLAAMGHTVSRFEPGLRTGRLGSRLGKRINQVRQTVYMATDNLPQVRARHVRGLWCKVEDAKPEFVIVCSDFLWPAEVSELKKLTAAPVVMWYPDAVSNFGKGYFMNAQYDALFFKDPFIVHRLSDVLFSPVYYLPECFNPSRHRSPDTTGNNELYKCDITTAGNSHSWRVAVFRHLEHYDIKLWGGAAPLWMPASYVSRIHQGRSVYNEEKALAFTEAKIVLNALHYAEMWGLNARAFEAAGIGSFQMVSWRPGLADLFVDGKELVAFKSMQNLKELIDHYLIRHDERQEIAAAGKRRAFSEHTYRHRLDLLLNTMAGRDKGFQMPRFAGTNEVMA